MAAALAIAAALVFGAAGMTGHMILHVALMNFLAPGVALLIPIRARKLRDFFGRSILFAAALQILLLWMLHAPAAMRIAEANPLAAFGGQALLFSVALWFWFAVFAQSGARRWIAFLTLVATGKLVCLLAALIVFAPRALYAAHGHAGPGALADQQLAGLLMLTACPLTYVGAATIIAARWFWDLSSGRTASSPSR